ncbi:MAG: methyltransferase domain-containing protein [Actinomycetota bacterium]|nr:methyltransferase domain-containing protein [Actinomycetota bacterium]
MSEWVEHAGWWLQEVAEDPIYRLDVLPLATELAGEIDGISLDLGCGEGQLMRCVPGRVVGCDISDKLLTVASASGPVVRNRLPDLGWLRTAVVEVAFAVMVFEHLSDMRLFEATARVVRPGGALVLVMNHPAFTADGAGPIMDQVDGEFLWRWGRYFDEATVRMSSGDRLARVVTFYHRPLATILNAAAASGWTLDRFVERGFSNEAIAAQPGYVGQEQMPRLLGARWVNTQGGRTSGR